MKKLFAILLLALCAAANATTYYVCDAARGTDAIGLDSRSAATASNKATPWLTYSKGLSQFGSLAAGDSIAFCDGGTFGSATAGNLVNANSTATNPVKITDYEPTGTLAPLTVTYSSSTTTQLTTGTALTSGAWNGLWLQITRGTGMGSYVQITTNTATQVNIAAWPINGPGGTPTQPDATSVIVLRQAKPIINCSSTVCLFFSDVSGNPIPPHYGYTISNLDFRGADTVNWGIGFKAGVNYLTLDNVSISHFAISAVQATDASLGSTVSAGDGRNRNTTIKNSTFTYTGGGVAALLLDGDDLLIENNYLDHNGSIADFFEHSIYLAGSLKIINPVTISSMTGNGTTVTVVTSTPHGIENRSFNTVVNVTGGSGGTGTFTTASAVVNYVNATTFTYPATGSGTRTGSAYFLQAAAANKNQIIRNNIVTNASPSSLGTCIEASIVMHGFHDGVLIENNILREDTPNSGSNSEHCYAIEIDSGQYSPPDFTEGFSNVTIRGNYIANYANCISLDLASGAVIENNYCYAANTSANVTGILFRGKNFSPTINYGNTWDGSSTSMCWGNSTACVYYTQPNNVTIRNNTIYFPNVTGQGLGIQLNANVGDPNVVGAVTTTKFRVVGNLIQFGAGSTSGSTCFKYDNMTTAAFDASGIDYNICYTAGAYTWATNTASGTLLAGASLATFKTNNATMDQHSLNTNPTITAPTSSTKPPYLLQVPTSGPAYNAGHPTKSSPYAIGGKKRSGTGSPSIGAFEPNATVVLPGSPTNVH